MVHLVDLHTLIRLHIEGKSVRAIAHEMKISKNTAQKYVRKYEDLYHQSLSGKEEDILAFQEFLNGPTRKKETKPRKRSKLTPEVLALIERILEDEKQKESLLGKRNKQMLTRTQIHRLVVQEGHDISLSTVSNVIKELLLETKECFIKQLYDYGDRFEYDFGECLLLIDGKVKRLDMAVMTACASGFRWAYLYESQKFDVFLESQIEFFEMIGGTFKEGVYDNMRNVVKAFHKSEKVINQKLLNFAHWYNFKVVTCNPRSGNEKGTVESAVKVIRREVFGPRYEFKNLEEARQYLDSELRKFNRKSTIEEEKEFLKPLNGRYESAVIGRRKVSNYSLISFENNEYSVPDYLVGQEVTVKAYAETIKIYSENSLIASHTRMKGNKKTCMDIHHYLRTLSRKPGALRNSQVLKEDDELHQLYVDHFTGRAKEFIAILMTNQNKSRQELVNVLHAAIEGVESESSTAQESEEYDQLQAISEMFV